MEQQKTPKDFPEETDPFFAEIRKEYPDVPMGDIMGALGRICAKGQAVGLFEQGHNSEYNHWGGEARRVMRNAADAVGINPKVAAQLSGADFDGDTVLVIPNPRGEIKTSSPLKGLADFDPKVEYREREGMVYMQKGSGRHGTQYQMGDISNLITDMSIKGASQEEIARAVRHNITAAFTGCPTA